MNRHAVFHQNRDPYAFATPPNRLTVRLRTAKGDLKRATVQYGDRYAPAGTERTLPMRIAGADADFAYWEATLALPTGRYRYAFMLETPRDTFWYTAAGLAADPPLWHEWFQVPYIWPSSSGAHEGQAPVAGGGLPVYHIFVDRFANGDPTNDPPGTQPWGAKPTSTSVHGGDLEGIRQRLPYLKELGIGAICLTPIFCSPSNHKYDTSDYTRIDPAFGDPDSLHRLVTDAHDIGIRVVLDAVFNHAGCEFPPFQDVLAHGQDSPYVAWFHIDAFPVQTSPPNYETFATGISTMPKLNTAHPEVQETLCSVAADWTARFGIDGWRLDVGNELHPDFIRKLRHRLLQVRSDILLVGESWFDAGPFLQGDMWDTATNYPWRDVTLDFFARRSIGATTFAQRLTAIRMRHGEPQNLRLWNLLGSHDTERLRTACKGSYAAALLAIAFQMTWPGTPVLYYGDEVAMLGDTDPDCRRCLTPEIEAAHAPFRQVVQALVRLRAESAALHQGGTYILLADALTHSWAHLRRHGNEAVLTVLHHRAGRVSWAGPSAEISIDQILDAAQAQCPDLPTRAATLLRATLTDVGGLGAHEGLVIRVLGDRVSTIAVQDPIEGAR